MNFFKLLVKKGTLQGGKNKLCVKIFRLKYLCISLLKIKIGYSPLEKFVLHLINLPGSLVPKEAYIEQSVESINNLKFTNSEMQLGKI